MNLDTPIQQQQQQANSDIFSVVRQRAAKSGNKKVSATGNWQVMGIVLDAVTETFQSQNVALSPLAYFGAFLSAVKKETKPSHIAATLQLIHITSPHLRPAAFQVPFLDPIVEIYERLMDEHGRSEMIMKQLLPCVTHVLQSQKNDAWVSGQKIEKLFQKLLLTSTDPKPSIQIKTRECLESLLQMKQLKPSMWKLASTNIAQLTGHMVESCTTKDTQKMISLLVLLQDILKFLSGSSITSIATQLLKLLSLEHPQLSCQSYLVFTNLFASDSNAISADSLSQLIQVLQNDRSLTTTDTASVVQYIKMLKTGAAMLKRLDEMECCTQLPSIFNTLLKFFEESRQEVAATTSDAVKALISDCIVDPMIDETLAEAKDAAQMEDDEQNYSTPLASIIDSFCKAINYKNKGNLDLVLGVQEQLFKRIGKSSYPLLNNMLVSMEQLYDSADFHFQSSLEKAISVAISAMGPRRVLELLPLNLSGTGRPRTWMFPVLKKGIRNTDLLFFTQYFMPLASQFLNRSTVAAGNGEKTTAKNYKNFYDQTYALLPGFCSYPTDFAQVFPKIAKHLGIILSQDTDLQPTICLALLKAINLSQEVIEGAPLPENVTYTAERAKQTLTTVAKSAGNFLPLLFTVYGETNEQVRGIISETIATISKISDQALVDEYFKQVLKKLLEAATELNKEDVQPQAVQDLTHKRNIMVDLALAMAPCLSPHTIQLLYQVFQPQMREINHTAQKKAYKAIYTICKRQRSFVQTHLQELLTTFTANLPVCDDASKNYRTKCLMTFVELMSLKDVEMYLSQFLAESIMNVKGKNKKSKESSYLFIRGLARKCTFGDVSFDSIDKDELPPVLSQEEQQRIFLFFQKLLAGLAANSDTMIGGTILVLSSLLVEFSSYLEPIIPEILKSVLILLQYNSNDVIIGVISFIKTCLAIIDDEVLKTIIPTLLPPLVEHSSKKGAGVIRPRVTYLLEKMIHRFGYEFCKSHFPQDKQTFIKNVYKTIKRQQNKKDGTDKKKARVGDDTIIRQGTDDEPLDLLDPSMINKIANKNKMDTSGADDENDIEIKTNKQGKLLITGDEPDVEESEDKKNKKDKKQKNKKRSRDDMEVEQAVDDFEFEGDDLSNEFDDEERAQKTKSAKRSRTDMESGSDGIDENRLAALRYLQKKQEDRKRRKTEVVANLGEEYRPTNRRAGGDAKRSGKADPFAYIPLDPKRLNRRFRNKSSDFEKYDKTVKQNRRTLVAKRNQKK